MSWKRQDYKYCNHCGAELVESNRRVYYYKTSTGEPVEIYDLRCPHASRFLASLHFKERFTGDDMIVERYS